MHAMLSGHTSLESALVRLMNLLGEDVPEGPQWHADLLRRAARGLTGRPALVGPALARAADRTRRFRHVAVRSYDSFDDELAQPALRAAEELARDLRPWIAELRRRLDPGPGT